MARCTRFLQSGLDVVCQRESSEIAALQLPSPPRNVDALFAQPTLAVALHITAPGKKFGCEFLIERKWLCGRFPLSLVPAWVRFEPFELFDGCAPRVAARREVITPAVKLLANVKRVVAAGVRDRKSTRLNSSHGSISYAVFCLKK